MSDEYRDDKAGFPPDPDPYGGQDAPPPPPPPEKLPPWEDRANYGLIAGFLNTIPQVMTAPGRFFTDHPTRRGLWGPVSFGVVMGVLVAIAEWIWSRVFTGFENSMYELLGDDYEVSPVEDAVIAFFESFGVFASPVLTLIMIFVVAGLVHLGVMLVSSNRDRGFEATLRATTYANAATVLSLVPICGSGVGAIWTLVIAVIGVRQIHGLGTGAALFAVLAPMVLCCCGCTGLIFAIVQIASR